MHEPHHMFDSLENQLDVSISPPLAHHRPSNFSRTLPLCSLSVCVKYWIKEALAFHRKYVCRFHFTSLRTPSLWSLPYFLLCFLSAPCIISKVVLLLWKISLPFPFQFSHHPSSVSPSLSSFSFSLLRLASIKQNTISPTAAILFSSTMTTRLSASSEFVQRYYTLASFLATFSIVSLYSQVVLIHGLILIWFVCLCPSRNLLVDPWTIWWAPRTALPPPPHLPMTTTTSR
jgi:hypothetical protein